MESQSLTSVRTSAAKNKFLILGIIFIAFNLRSGITSVGPLIGSIRNELGISNGVAGLITTIPLLSFAICSPLIPRLGRKFGNELTLFAGLIIMIMGILIRSTGITAALFAGTALIGVGVAMGNVLLPSVVKQKFPEKVGLMTSLYSTAMGVFAALASGLSIPLSEGLNLGWKNTLGFWVLLVLLAAVVWVPQLHIHRESAGIKEINSIKSPLLRSPLAWQVTFFMGLQSFLFYCAVAWFPAILQSKGMSVSMAGWMLSFMQLVSLPASFITPIVAARLENQKVIAGGVGILDIIGITGLIIGGNGSLIVPSIFIIGIAQGASISLVLTLFGLRTTNAKQAAELSGMAQSIGYLLAATGPILIGFLFDKTHSWTVPLAALIAVSAVLIIMGIGAGRNQYVLQSAEEIAS